MLGRGVAWKVGRPLLYSQRNGRGVRVGPLWVGSLRTVVMGAHCG